MSRLKATYEVVSPLYMIGFLEVFPYSITHSYTVVYARMSLHSQCYLLPTQPAPKFRVFLFRYHILCISDAFLVLCMIDDLCSRTPSPCWID